MAGLVPVIHDVAAIEPWMAGTSPAMTVVIILGFQHTTVIRS
jgi:hypothetical protein